MPVVKKSSKELFILRWRGLVEMSLTVKGWDKQHFAQILKWDIKKVYRMFPSSSKAKPQIPTLDEFYDINKKLGIKVDIKESAPAE